jgi:hypothetical protein
MRIERKLAVLLEHLRRIAASPAVHPVELLTPALGPVVVTAATPTVIIIAVIVVVTIIIQGTVLKTRLSENPFMGLAMPHVAPSRYASREP